MLLLPDMPASPSFTNAPGGGKASEYTVFVTAGNYTNSSTFDIATYNTLLETPDPGGGGVLAATMPTTTTVAVTFNTTEVTIYLVRGVNIEPFSQELLRIPFPSKCGIICILAMQIKASAGRGRWSKT